MCAMARRWVCYRLSEQAHVGRAILIRRGYWRASRMFLPFLPGFRLRRPLKNPPRPNSRISLAAA
jgi:hypothetical protein